MAARTGVFATISRILFALPFVGFGGMFVVGAFTGHVKPPGPAGAIFGLIFGGVGVYQIVLALRGRRSRESASAPLGPGATLAELRPQGPMDYRHAARRTTRAAQMYAPVLASAPLPRPKTSPGRSLPIALGITRPKGEIVLLLVSLAWTTGAVIPFVGLLVTRAWGGAAFVALFVLVGLALLISTARKVLSRIKLPAVEISEEPVFLGDELHVHVEQRGPARIGRLRVDLVCTERASYTVGTTTRTEEHQAFHHELLDESGRTLGFGERWPHDLRVVLPTTVPHSFTSQNNVIAWTVHVRAEIAGWPDYDEHFELRALPRVPA